MRRFPPRHKVHARDPGSTQSGAQGDPITFTAKSMTLLTATSARSSAIFLPRPPAGSGRPVPALSPPGPAAPAPALFCACAPNRQPINGRRARLCPRGDQSEGRREGRGQRGGTGEAGPGAEAPWAL